MSVSTFFLIYERSFTVKMADWGKKAATRIDRSQFGNDELLKSLGQEFNLDFANYDQWQRKKTSRRPPPPKKSEYPYHCVSIFTLKLRKKL